MASRTTRNKLRHQAKEAYENLKRAQENMTNMARMISEAGSEAYSEIELPAFIASTEAVLVAWEKFWQAL